MKNVLIVDDSADSIELIDKVISHYGARSFRCSNGAAALALLEQQEFDLMVLDWDMPIMNGKTTLICADTVVGRHPRGVLPVVMHSSADGLEEQLPSTDNIRYLGICNKSGGYKAALKDFSNYFSQLDH